MNNLLKNLFLLVSLCGALLINTAGAAGVKVTGVNWVSEQQRGRFVVDLKGVTSETPEWSTKGNRLSMVIPGATIDKGIVRYISGIRVAAANVSNGVLTTLTFLNGGAIDNERVSLTLKDTRIEVAAVMPAGFQPIQAAPVVSNERKPAILKSDLGENFLKQLEDESNVTAVVAVKKDVATKKISAAQTQKDEVKSVQAAPSRKETNFSIATYAGKFVIFLALVLGVFWGVVQLMKRGVLSKGKLGFLNGSSLVSVISTTYISPKKSILLVKAHNQVFLVGSSETGFEFLSEVKDVPGLVKEGEKFITGDNFDDIQNVENRVENKVLKIKEDIYESRPLEEKTSLTKVNKDIARFSDELKKKVKNLKTLQQ